MADQRLVDYIRSYMSAGYSASQIEQSLVNAGWDRRSIREAMNESGMRPAFRMPTAPVATGQPVPQAAGTQQPSQQGAQAAPVQRLNIGIFGRFLAVLGSPGRFFMMVKPEKGYDTPVKYYLFLMFIQIIIANALLGLSLWLGSAFFDPSLVNPLMGIIGINTAADFLFANVGLAINIVLLFAVAWLLNKIIRAMGGKGELVDTLKGLVYSYTPNVILTLVSLPLVLGMMVMGIDPGMILVVGSISFVISLVFGVWVLYLSLKSQAVFHDISMGKAFGAFLATGFIIYIIITAIMFVFIMMFLSTLGASLLTIPTV